MELGRVARRVLVLELVRVVRHLERALHQRNGSNGEKRKQKQKQRDEKDAAYARRSFPITKAISRAFRVSERRGHVIVRIRVRRPSEEVA